MEIGTNIKRGKVWGNTRCLFCKNNTAFHRIEVNKGGFCSRHHHQSKYNMFYVETGKIEVTIYRPDANQIIEDKTVVSAGETTFVEPGLKHTFRGLEDSVAFEIYWVELDPEDIIRENVGGREMAT